MKHLKIRGRSLAVVCGLLFALGIAGAAPAEEKAAPQISPEEMQRMMSLMQPSDVHHRMAGLVGTWKTTMKMYEGPGEPTVTEGSATYEMILGGRYLVSHHSAEFMGMPFEGMGIDAYDNAQKKYISLWLDNFGTGVMQLTGQPTKDNLGIDFVGTMFDPMVMAETKVREEIRHQGPDQFTFAMYQTDPKGQERKVMEMSGTRQK